MFNVEMVLQVRRGGTSEIECPSSGNSSIVVANQYVLLFVFYT